MRFFRTRRSSRDVINKKAKRFDKKIFCKYNVCMKPIHFEWNKIKSKNNEKKHDISFQEASTVFSDGFAIEFYDKNHSNTETRFLLLGLSTNLNLLLICYCYCESDEIIRIISARKATKKESKHYKRC